MIMLDKRNLWFSMLCLGFLMLGCQNSDSKLHAQDANKKQKVTKPHVTMVEYADFQCPTCAYFYPIVKKLQAHYGDQLHVTFKYFPLNDHQYSMIAARAAQAARNQGKFDQMHDLLFKNQQTWANSGNPQGIFDTYAKKIGLNIKQFDKDLNAGKTQKTVMEQKNKGIKRGVNSTPSFYINGEEIVTLPRTYKEFKTEVDVYIKEAQQTAKSN